MRIIELFRGAFVSKPFIEWSGESLIPRRGYGSSSVSRLVCHTVLVECVSGASRCWAKCD